MYKRRSNNPYRMVPCKFCNTPNLHWTKNGLGQWHLFSRDNALHTCEHLKSPPPTEEQTTQTRPKTEHDGLADIIFEALKPRLGNLLDRNALEAQIAAVATRVAEGLNYPVRIEYKTSAGDIKKLDRQHKTFPRLLRLIGQRQNVYMRGPAGSGKTVAAEKCAEALELAFYPKSMGPATGQHEIMGYMGATGGYVKGLLRDPFENGGVFLADEIDNSNPQVLTVLNTALANEYCAFPDKVVRKHKDFICIASGNTFGLGADQMYVGRQQLDAATLDRFVTVNWDYDEDFEMALAKGMAENTQDASIQTSITDWCKRVQQIRAAVFLTKMRIVVSPRATLFGARMLLDNMKVKEVEEATIWVRVSEDDKKKVLANVKAI
jgi:hypothetical protein